MKLVIEFTDPPNNGNYYEIMCPNNNYFYCGNSGLHGGIDYWQLETEDAVLLAENESGWGHSLIFSDNMINDKKTKISVLMGNIYTDCDEFTEFKINVELRSISYQYYQYRQKMQKYLEYAYSGHDLESFYEVGEPVIMYTNVENGYGVFVAHSSDIKTITYP